MSLPIPRERLLTDGPFATAGRRALEPPDVMLAEAGLARIWGCDLGEVRSVLRATLERLSAASSALGGPPRVRASRKGKGMRPGPASGAERASEARLCEEPPASGYE